MITDERAGDQSQKTLPERIYVLGKQGDKTNSWLPLATSKICVDSSEEKRWVVDK